MNEITVALAREYAAAMHDYLNGKGEVALRRAFETGRKALAEGVGVLEMVTAHQSAVMRATRSSLNSRHRDDLLERAWNCLVESLSPFEMVLRGVQEANTRLQDSLSGLRRVEEQLRGQNAELTAAQQTLEKERSRYQALFDFAPDGYLITGLEGAIREANAAAAAILHTPKELLPGQSLLEFVVKADSEAFRQRLRALHQGSVTRIEDWQISIQPHGRSPIPAALTVVAERSAPAISSLRWLIRDVTERKRLEKERARWMVGQAKAQAARRFEFLAAASSLLVGSLDGEASLVSAARFAVSFPAAWCFIGVVEPDGSLRQLEVAHADPAVANLAARLRRHCLFGGNAEGARPALPPGPEMVEPLTAEWLDRVADSPAHAVLLRQLNGGSAMVLPLQAHGRPIGILVLVSARGSRRYRPADRVLGEEFARRCAMALENARLYREVVAERDKAQRASRAKDEFVAILGHELRNPLTPVLGWTRVLKNNKLIASDPILSEGVRALEKSAATLTRLVGECVDMTRISEGKIQIERVPLDLNRVVAGSVEAVRDAVAERGMHVAVELSPEVALVQGDAMRIEQVVMNLLINAVKYSGRGGVISVRTAVVGAELEIEVADTGIGIATEFLQQIFEPFRQGTSSWLTSQSGLGLGLAIARQIVEMHGGRVWAESAGLGRGSTFRVRLPLATGNYPASRLPASYAQPPASPDRHVRVLLVEDSEDIVFLMKSELERLGHTVFSAADGQLGSEAAVKLVPDVIISDIRMPVADGYALIREIRRVPELRHTPAIALTGFGSTTDVERALAAGFNACLSKPAEPAEVAALISRLTGPGTLAGHVSAVTGNGRVPVVTEKGDPG